MSTVPHLRDGKDGRNVISQETCLYCIDVLSWNEAGRGLLFIHLSFLLFYKYAKFSKELLYDLFILKA